MATDDAIRDLAAALREAAQDIGKAIVFAMPREGYSTRQDVEDGLCDGVGPVSQTDATVAVARGLAIIGDRLDDLGLAVRSGLRDVAVALGKVDDDGS